MIEKSVLNWLILGVLALLTCGLLSVFVVFLRIPYFGNSFLNAKSIFDISLVIHVNLSIYVWFFTIMSMVYSGISVNFSAKFTSVLSGSCNTNSFLLLAAGSVMLVFSAFVSDSVVIKTNYVPIINNLMFFTAIAFIAASILVNSIFVLRFITEEFNVCSMAIILIISFAAFLIGYFRLSETLTLEEYYEYLFCGFGHLIQFAFCQLIMIIYLHINDLKTNKIVNLIFVLNLIFALMGLLIYFVYDNAMSISQAFTTHMKVCAGIAPTFIILYILIARWREALLNFGFLLSTFLFFYGGFLGFISSHGSVSIPAHYHGSVVALTVGMMAFIYNLLTYKKMRLANIQMCIYVFGQLMHITSLAVMGGYGALRKTTSMVSSSDVLVQVCFALGGLIAMIGGFMFIAILLGNIFFIKKKAFV